MVKYRMGGALIGDGALNGEFTAYIYVTVVNYGKISWSGYADQTWVRSRSRLSESWKPVSASASRIQSASASASNFFFSMKFFRRPLIASHFFRCLLFEPQNIFDALSPPPAINNDRSLTHRYLGARCVHLNRLLNLTRNSAIELEYRLESRAIFS